MATEIPMVTAEERDWATAAARARDISSWDRTTDVLGGGYGGAGGCAAIEVAAATSKATSSTLIVTFSKRLGGCSVASS